MEASEHKGLLEDLILEMMQSNETSLKIEKSISMSNNYLNDINANAWATFESIHELKVALEDSIGILASEMTSLGTSMSTIAKNTSPESGEDKKEAKKLQEQMVEALKGIKKNTEEKTKARDLSYELPSGLAGVMGAISGLGTALAALFAGFAAGVLSGFGKVFKALAKDFGKMFTTLGDSKWVTSIREFIGKKFDRIATIFKLNVAYLLDEFFDTRFGKWVKSVSDFFGSIMSKGKSVLDSVKSIGTRVSSFGTYISNTAKAVTDIFTDSMKAFKEIKSLLSGFGKGNMVLTFIKNVVGAFGDVVRFAFNIGKALAKFALPLQIIMGAFDFVTGAIEGFKKEGVFGAFKEGFAKMLGGIAGGLGDLVKNIISWVANKLGFTEFSKALDAFSFTEMISNSVRGIFDWFKSIFTNPAEAFSVAWKNLVGEGGLIDLMFAPVNWVVNWVKDAFKIGDPNIQFSMSGVFRDLLNGIIDVLAGIAEYIPLKGKEIADKIRSYRTASDTKATTSITQLGRVEPKVSETPVMSKAVTPTGDMMAASTAEVKNTQVKAEATRDAASVAAVIAGSSGGGGGGNTANVSNSATTVNVSSSSLPDRTDWSIMSGNFGLPV